MMIETLIDKIRSISSDESAIKLAEIIESWKDDDSSIDELESKVERYIGNSWIASKAEHNEIYSEWEKFRNNEIRQIHGMTMNERLFTFGIFDRFDSITTEQEKLAIYAKLLAKP